MTEDGLTEAVAAATGTGRFVLQAKDDTVLLTVPPPKEGESPPTASEIVKECSFRGFTDLDMAQIEVEAARASGKPVPVGKRKVSGARVEVEVSKDAMEAAMIIHPPGPGGMHVTREDIDLALKAAGVTYGLDEEILDEMVAGRVYNEPRIVARGKETIEGKDGYVEHHFELEKKAVPVSEDETGKVDYKELDLIENVAEGHLLATLHPPTQGEGGVTVTNEYNPAAPGKAVAIGAGKNTTLSDDGTELRAAVNGMVMVLGGKITVSPVYQIKGSVGPETGNVNFIGSVVVTDGVDDGYSVKATESITIGKTIGKAEVRTGGDLVVRGGVMGKNEALIEVEGDMEARFIQEAQVMVKGEVRVQEAVMHADIEAGERVVVGSAGGKRGLIVGGQVRALKEVACKTLGAEMSTKTSVEVGISPRTRRRLEELEAQIHSDKKNFDKVRKGLIALQAIKAKLGQLPEDKEKILQSLRAAQESLKVKLQEMASELKDLQVQTSVNVKGRISVSDTIYPGVKVGIGNATMYITNTEKYVTLVEEAGEIRIKTYEAPKEKGKEKRKKAKERE